MMRRIVVLVALLVTCVSAAAAAPATYAAAGRIAYVHDGDIWTVAADGTAARRLTGGSRDDASPAWSPDRATVAFVRLPADDDWGDTPAICTVPAAGGASHAVRYKDSLGKTDFHFINCLAYSPDGKKLAFSDTYLLSAASDNRYEHNRVVVIDLRTGRTTVLIKRHNGFDGALDAGWAISWSPDGRSLLIGQWGQSAEGGEAHVFTIASRRLRKLPIPDATWVDWSPDGDTIVLSTATQIATSVLLAQPTGTVLRTLLRGLGWDATTTRPAYQEACYSPDGDWLAYTVHPSGADNDTAVWIMKTDGSARQRVKSGSSPAWR